MFKTKIKYQSEIIFSVLIMLIYFLIFNLGGKKVLAAENGKVNLDLWTLGEINNAGEATLTDYQIDNNLKDIVIPTAADYIESDSTKYKNLRKVYITRKAMNKAAKHGDKEGGSLKISDTGTHDSDFDEDNTKVFAEGRDWSYTFSGYVNSFGGFTINYIEIIDLSRFDTGNVTNMSGMFRECSNLKELDISKWNTSKVDNMSYMIDHCENLVELDLNSWDMSNVASIGDMFAGCKNLKKLNISNWKISKVSLMNYTFYQCVNLNFLDLNGWNKTWKPSEKKHFSFTPYATSPLLVRTGNSALKNYDYKNDNRTLFTTTLKVDGKNVQFRGGDESEFVKYNGNKTEKYINIYETYTTTDGEGEILQKLADRLEEEKNNLIVAPGYENLEWEPEKDTEGKVSYSLQNVYTIKRIDKEKDKDNKEKDKDNEEKDKDNEEYKENNEKDKNIEGRDKNYSWSTIENSGGSSGGGNLSSPSNKNLISNNESTNTKINMQTKSELPEKLRTGKYLFGYPDGKMKPENYVTNAEFATIIYRLMNNGEEISYDKLKNIGVEKSDWFADAVAYLMDDSRKIINVTGKKFNSNKNISGYEMLNIIHNVLKFYDADKNFIDNQNLSSNVTRVEMAKMIFNAFDGKNNLGQKIYPDLDKNHWAYKFLMDASE